MSARARRSALVSMRAAALAAALAAGCRAPTEWRLIVHSDVPCASAPRVVLWTGPDLEAARAGSPRATAATCGDATDDVVLIPDGDAAGFVVALATRVDGGDPALCASATPPTGCVTQSWRLSFREHVSQTFETSLSKSCADVRCDPGSTCVRPGVCVADAPSGSCEQGCSAAQGVTAAPVDVYAAGDVTCVRDGRARVTCWGAGADGVLGRGSIANAGDALATVPAALGPIDFGAGRTVARFALAADHACAILDDQSLRCWGANADGQLGYGDTTPRGVAQHTVPAQLAAIPMPAGRVARDVAVGKRSTCVILDDGTLRCWGAANTGALGYGDTTPRGGTPATVPALLPAVPLGAGITAKRLAIGSVHMCAVRSDDALICWGANTFGELGQGDTTPRGGALASTPAGFAPIALGPGRVADRAFASIETTCVTTAAAEVLCWGIGGNGVLGNGSAATLGDTPGTAPAQLPAIGFGAGAHLRSFALGDTGACAVLADGTARCWGTNNEGELGYGDTTIRGLNAATLPAALPPLPTPAGRTIRSMAIGTAHACAIYDDGALRCWGRNTLGQLGYGDVTRRGDAPETAPDRLGAIALPK